MINSVETGKHPKRTVALGGAALGASQRLRELLAERQGRLPVWIRSPKSGPEFYSGFTRSKLYEEAAKGHIRSVSIRKPGAVKGTRLFELKSILGFIEKCEAKASKTSSE